MKPVNTNKASKRGEDRGGLVGRVYEMKVLPNTASQLLEAVYKQKDLSRAEAREMAEYLDERYGMSDFVPPTQPIKQNPSSGESKAKETQL